MELYQAGGDLVVRVGPMMRCIPLPNVLAGMDVTSAKLDDGVLRVEGKEYVVQDGDVMHFLFNV